MKVDTSILFIACLLKEIACFRVAFQRLVLKISGAVPCKFRPRLESSAYRVPGPQARENEANIRRQRKLDHTY